MNVLARARTDATVRRARVVAVLVLLAVVVFGATHPALTGRGAVTRTGPHPGGGVAAVSVVVLAAGVAVLLLGAVVWWRPWRRRRTEPDHTQREVVPLTRVERALAILGALLIVALLGLAVWQVIRLVGPTARGTPAVRAPSTPPQLTGRPAPMGSGARGTGGRSGDARLGGRSRPPVGAAGRPGVMASTITTLRWPGNGRGDRGAARRAVDSPAVASALGTGLLIAVYLVVLDGAPPPRGLASLAVGVALAVLATLGAVAGHAGISVVGTGRRARHPDPVVAGQVG